MYCSNCGKEIKDGAKFCSECGQRIIVSTEPSDTQKDESCNETTKSNVKRKQIDKPMFIALGLGAIIFVFLFVICCFLPKSVFPVDISHPREPQELECVNYKNLCIATTDVEYDYTAVKTRSSGYPAYNKEWNNGWASAQKACEAWGGRLPSMEDFVTIVEASKNHKIKLKEYGNYLSSTQINAYRIYAYSHDSDLRKEKIYDSKSIYDTAIAIDKSGDWIITGNYDTGTAYTWKARCVKDINTNTSTPTNKTVSQEIKKDIPEQKSDANVKVLDANNVKQTNFRKEMVDDMNHYMTKGGSFYGVIMHQLDLWKSSADENRDINLHYINQVKSHYDTYYGYAKNNNKIEKLPDIKITNEDFPYVSEDVKNIVNGINSMKNSL